MARSSRGLRDRVTVRGRGMRKQREQRRRMRVMRRWAGPCCGVTLMIGKRPEWRRHWQGWIGEGRCPRSLRGQEDGYGCVEE